MQTSRRRSDQVEFGIRIPPCGSVVDVARVAAAAEASGFDVAWVADSQLLWRDVFAALALSADRTSSIVLASAVTNFVTRHPTVVASAINTVAELAPGRTWLGVGTGDSSVKPLAMSPSRRSEMREALTTTRALLRGEECRFGTREVRLRDAHGSVPVHVAASGARTLELAGEVADGVVSLAGVSRSTLLAIVEAIHAGMVRGERPEESLRFTVGAFCHITDDIERDARILKPICLHQASIGAQAFLRVAGIELEPPPRVPSVYPDMVHAEDWDLAVERASEFVTDDMAVRFAKEFCLFGTVEEIVTRIRGAVEAGATGFYLRHVGNYTFPWEVIESFGSDVLPVVRSSAEVGTP